MPVRTDHSMGLKIQVETLECSKTPIINNHPVFVEAAGLCAQNWVPWQKKRSMYVSAVAVAHCSHGNGISTSKAVFTGNVGKIPWVWFKIKGLMINQK